MRSTGRNSTSSSGGRRAATRAEIPSAMIASVSKGRCGPCCSWAPSGRTAMAAGLSAVIRLINRSGMRLRSLPAKESARAGDDAMRYLEARRAAFAITTGQAMAKSGKTSASARLQSAARLSRTALAARLLQHGFYAGQDQIMLALAESDGLTPGGLARRIGVRPPTITKTINRLQGQGFVERRASESDSRQAH